MSLTESVTENIFDAFDQRISVIINNVPLDNINFHDLSERDIRAILAHHLDPIFFESHIRYDDFYNINSTIYALIMDQFNFLPYESIDYVHENRVQNEMTGHYFFSIGNS